ncbi:hypothetical protein BDN70DRAFT_678981 [Pholiota conissans]|uniref:Uncharacterized protein n=1 Tax=Pholiota conissans TaxID=109636 RepID=A0A9P5ZEG8_9AGAR|nr:hypothetical protein BDN70DRAFT_678981 [Pholiota conissans]
MCACVAVHLPILALGHSLPSSNPFLTKNKMTSSAVPSSIFISLARMHHISNPSKFRRLKRFAAQSCVSGFVKTGKPGILVFDGPQSSIKEFLEHARGLRYLDFHHVDTKPLNGGPTTTRLADGRVGLEEVKDTSELLRKLDGVGEREWFRRQIGMQKGD